VFVDMAAQNVQVFDSRGDITFVLQSRLKEPRKSSSFLYVADNHLCSIGPIAHTYIDIGGDLIPKSLWFI